MTGPYKKGKFGHKETHTEGRQCEDPGRTPPTSQGAPEATRSQEGDMERSSVTATRRNQVCQHLDFEFLDSRTDRQ